MNKRYSSPHSFQTSKELNKAKQEARKFFPAKAVNNYQDAQGNHILSVKQPVSTIGDNPIADSVMTDK